MRPRCLFFRARAKRERKRAKGKNYWSAPCWFSGPWQSWHPYIMCTVFKAYFERHNNKLYAPSLTSRYHSKPAHKLLYLMLCICQRVILSVFYFCIVPPLRPSILPFNSRCSGFAVAITCLQFRLMKWNHCFITAVSWQFSKWILSSGKKAYPYSWTLASCQHKM